MGVGGGAAAFGKMVHSSVKDMPVPPAGLLIGGVGLRLCLSRSREKPSTPWPPSHARRQ